MLQYKLMLDAHICFDRGFYTSTQACEVKRKAVEKARAEMHKMEAALDEVRDGLKVMEQMTIVRYETGGGA